MQPDISIITVTYNANATIRRCMESVIAQSNVSYEYILIDGGSTDGTLEIICEYSKKLAYFVSEPDYGIYDAMRKGIAKSKGKLVGIINADDWYAPGCLKSVYDLYLQNPLAVIHADMMLVAPNGESLYCLPAPDAPSIHTEFKKMTVNHPATFIPRCLYEMHGGFDLSYRLSSDYELIIRLLSKGVPFVPLHKVTSYFRLGGQSGGVKTYKENFVIQRKYGRSLIGSSGWFVKSLVKLWISQRLPAPVWVFVSKLKNRSVSKVSVG